MDKLISGSIVALRYIALPHFAYSDISLLFCVFQRDGKNSCNYNSANFDNLHVDNNMHSVILYY